MEQMAFTLLVVFGLGLSAVSAAWAAQQQEEVVRTRREKLTKSTVTEVPRTYSSGKPGG